MGRWAGRPEGCVVLAMSAGRKGPARGVGYAKAELTVLSRKFRRMGIADEMNNQSLQMSTRHPWV